MSLGHEIDYDALIDRAIKDFEPVKRLWPVGTRLFFWILLESAILALTGAFLGYYPLPAETGKTGLILSLGLPIFASIVAAFFALRGGGTRTRGFLARVDAVASSSLWRSFDS